MKYELRMMKCEFSGGAKIGILGGIIKGGEGQVLGVWRKRRNFRKINKDEKSKTENVLCKAPILPHLKMIPVQPWRIFGINAPGRADQVPRGREPLFRCFAEPVRPCVIRFFGRLYLKGRPVKAHFVHKRI